MNHKTGRYEQVLKGGAVQRRESTSTVTLIEGAEQVEKVVPVW